MSRRKTDPLRPLTPPEHDELTRLARSRSAPAVQVARAIALLAVHDGRDYQQAARDAGRKSGDAVSQLVRRFNQEGLAALVPRHAGGPAVLYDVQARERILQEARRTPTPAADGTATWSLTTLQKALRNASDGLPHVSTFIIWQTLHAAGLSFQRTRTWCPTGQATRKRKRGTVVVTDPDALPKKS